MNIIKPNRLKPNSTISIIAPAGNVEERKVLSAKTYFESLGYKVKLGKNIFNQNGYLAGTDEERLSDLHNAFADKETDAIFCARGGYGALRIAGKIDYEIIKSNPKIFCGYSDITILSAIIFKNTGLITYSAPMPCGDFQFDNINTTTNEAFFNALTNSNIEIIPTDKKVYRPGNAEGLLIGGNLSSFASLGGTDFIPDDKFILFAEDINEPAYKIDRYFRQLLNIKGFKQHLTGIILGEFLDTDNVQYLQSIFHELGEELKIPIIGEYPISHSDVKYTIPYGGYAKLTEGTLRISY